MKEKVIKDNGKGFSMSFKYDGSDDSFIYVDKKAIQQVFNNVIKNAIEASDNINNLIINILAEETDKECIIKVLDNGKGFECEPENIFEPMFTTKAQGTGLGLVISQAIIEGHNGRIYAERDKEKELTCFNIVLPKASSNELEGDSVEK